MAGVEFKPTQEDKDKLDATLSFMTASGRSSLLELHRKGISKIKPPKKTPDVDISAIHLVVIHPETQKEIKAFESHHLQTFISDNFKKNGIKREQFSRKLTKSSLLRNFVDQSTSADFVEEVFDKLAPELKLGKFELFYEFLKFCFKEHRPLRTFYKGDEAPDKPDDEKIYSHEKHEAYTADLERRLDEAKNADPIPPNPYKGLATFTSDDANHFYGRDDEIGTIFERLETSSFLALIGASGSGKSSLMLAGVIPEAENKNWLCITLRLNSTKEREPLFILAENLIEHAYKDKLLSEYVDEDANLTQQLNDKEKRFKAFEKFSGKAKSEHEKLIIYIDQFEELFTDTISSKDADNFISFLSEFHEKTKTRKGIDNDIVFVLSMRSDFMAHVNKDSRLTPLFDIHYTLSIVAPTAKENLEQIIKLPAKNVDEHGVTYESDALERILSDIRSSSISLSLIQFSLKTLWEKQHKRKITHQHYVAIGGVSGAFANKISDWFESLSDDDKQVIEHIFINLVGHNDDKWNVKKTVKLDSFNQEEQKKIADMAKSELRLLTLDAAEKNHTQTVELIHDALIVEWGRFQEWIVFHKVFLSWQDKVSRSAENWMENKTHNNLLTGDALDFAKSGFTQYRDRLGVELAQCIESSIAYAQEKAALKEQKRKEEELRKEEIIKQQQINIDVEKKARQEEHLKNEAILNQHREKRLSNRILATAALALISVLIVFSFTANKLKNEALIQNKRLLASISSQLLNEGKLRLSILIALEALDGNFKQGKRDDISYQNASNVLKAINGKYIKVDAITPLAESSIRGLYDITPDLQQLAYESHNGDIIVMDALNSTEVIKISTGVLSDISSLKFDSTGKYITLTFYGTEPGQVWKVEEQRKVASLDRRYIDDISISNDHFYIFAKDSFNVFTLGYVHPDSFEYEEILRAEDGDFISLSQDGCCFFYGEKGRLKKNILNQNHYEEQITVTDQYNSTYAISPDHQFIYAYGEDGILRYSDLQSFLASQSLESVDFPYNLKIDMRNIIFNREGDFLAFAGFDLDGKKSSAAHIFHTSSGKYINSLPFGNRSSLVEVFDISSQEGVYLNRYNGDGPIFNGELDERLINVVTGDKVYGRSFGSVNFSIHSDSQFIGASNDLAIAETDLIFDSEDIFGTGSIGIWKKVRFPDNVFFTQIKNANSLISFEGDDSLIIYENASIKFSYYIDEWNINDLNLVRRKRNVEYDSVAVLDLDPPGVSNSELDYMTAISIDGEWSITSEADNEADGANRKITLRDIKNNKETLLLEYLHKDAIYLGFSDNGKYVYSYDFYDNVLFVWSTESASTILHQKLSELSIKNVGKIQLFKDLAIITDKNKVFVLNILSGELLSSHEAIYGNVLDIALSKNGEAMIWHENAKVISVLDISKNKIIFSYNVGKNEIYSIAISDNAKNLAWVDSQNQVVAVPIKHINDKQLIDSFRNLGLHSLTPEEKRLFHLHYSDF